MTTMGTPISHAIMPFMCRILPWPACSDGIYCSVLLVGSNADDLNHQLCEERGKRLQGNLQRCRTNPEGGRPIAVRAITGGTATLQVTLHPLAALLPKLTDKIVRGCAS